MNNLTDQSGFIWGVATSSYQIEGSQTGDGRGDGIWDRFSARMGAIKNGDDASVACDHLNRFEEDIALMRQLGIDSYRFSMSWPRLIPKGVGAANQKGIDFYDRLLDTLLSSGIAPSLTLYHWDLPCALEAKGGWQNRDIANWLTEFALFVDHKFGDRLGSLIVLNEACMTSHRGYGWGTDAPGVRSRDAFYAAIHHQNLAQGRVIRALRSNSAKYEIGTTALLQPALPASDSEADQRAAKLLDATWNRAVLDPLLLGQYPELIEEDLAKFIDPGDMREIAAAIDFLGVNYYVRSFVSESHNEPIQMRRERVTTDRPKSPFGMELYAEGLGQALQDLRENYGNPKIKITECGYADVSDMALAELLDDRRRIEFLESLMAQISQANNAGSRVEGFYVWSLLDNFEWEFGYWPRFGIVHVDYESQVRTPKSSFYWYANFIKSDVKIDVTS